MNTKRKLIYIPSVLFIVVSLLQSIVARKSAPTEGLAQEISTVGVELECRHVDGVSVEFYDCGGQVDYAGMQQIFLTRRALYVLIWDVTTCVGRRSDDLREVLRENIMRWLYTLTLRAPGSTVIMAANKCDEGRVENWTSTAVRVEREVKSLLAEWQEARASDDESRQQMEALHLITDGICLSCLDYGGVEALISRISGQDLGAAEIAVPPSWHLALTVLDALRAGVEPEAAARERLKLEPRQQSLAAERNRARTYISADELSRIWRGIRRSLVSEVRDRSAENEAALSCPDSAMKGALWISEFAGRALLIDGGKGVFLDVLWMTKCFSPIMSHKLKNWLFRDAEANFMKDKLVQSGILHWRFARYLWRDELNHRTLQGKEDDVLCALFDVLIRLGVVVPIGRQRPISRRRRASNMETSLVAHQDMLVIMRLDDKPSERQQHKLRLLVTELEARDGSIALKWRFDEAGPPYGLVERVIASCHAIGEVQTGSCWRMGAVFRAWLSAEANAVDAQRENLIPYTVLIGYELPGEETREGPMRTLTVRMLGDRKNGKLWAAFRYVASSVAIFSKDWKGAVWEGWVFCPDHPDDRTFLTSSAKASIGSPLVAERPIYARTYGCPCAVDQRGWLALASQRLGTVMDIREDDPFDEGQDVVEAAGETTAVACPSARLSEWWTTTWTALRGELTSRRLATTALFFSGATVTGIVEGVVFLWAVSLALSIILLFGAVVFTVSSETGSPERAEGEGPEAV